MKRLALLLCLVFVAPATASVPPPPPGGVDWEYGPDGLTLLWEAVEDTGGSPLANYVVYASVDGVLLPPVPADEPEHTWGFLDDGSVYTFRVTAQNVDGDESAPSLPLVLRGGLDYPYCTVLPIYTNPPQVPEPHAWCLLPPPI